MAQVQRAPFQEAHQGLPSLDPSTHDETHHHISSSASSSGPGVHSGPVTARLHFYAPPEDGSAPYNYVETPTNGDPQRNFGVDSHDVEIQDARGHEKEFKLDTHAFETLQGQPHNPSIDWHDDESIKKHYYPEVEKLLLNGGIPGTPKKIFLFDHTVRRANPDSPRAPVQRAHIDQTPKSAAHRVRRHYPDAAEHEEYLKGRYRIINVWRPLNGPVESDPLAFAASDTVPDGDMVGVEHRYPTWSGETAAVRYNADHKWYYWSGIDNDERLLLQCFDSDNPMNRVPHTAFLEPRSTKDSKRRESIEVRALILV